MKRRKQSLKNNTLITTREFLRTFAKLTSKPKSKSYTVVKHGKPIGIFIPSQDEDIEWQSIEHYKDEIAADALMQKTKKQITLKDLRRHRFHSGEKNLSQRIDEIVYGIKQ